MPGRVGRRSVSALDKFVEWLQMTGSKAYNGRSLLAHYMTRNQPKSHWDVLVKELRTKKSQWTFLRGQLSVDELNLAKKSYIDRFVFICNEQPSEPYINALLGIEECQLKLRMGVESSDIVRCPECRAKDLEIRALKEQLRRVGEEATMDSRLELLRTEFIQGYKHDPYARMPRSKLREEMEEFLKREYNECESLSPTSDLWRIFLTDVVKAPSQGPLRYSSRRNSLASALSCTDTPLSPVIAPRERKRHRPIDGAGDLMHSLACERQIHGSRH